MTTIHEPGAQTSLPDLGGLPGVARPAKPEVHRLETVYFDTGDLALAGRGVTLRRCDRGSDVGWYLELPGASGREEAWPPAARSETPPPQLSAAILALTRGAPLTPVATLRTRRTAHRLLAEDDGCLAEVHEDLVNAFEGASGHALSSWREWRVELVGGDRRLLDGAGALLESVGASPVRAPSHLARVLGVRVGPPGHGRPRRKGPVGALLRARLAEQVEVLLLRDLDVRRDAPGGVHQLRVAVRRLRSAQATFRSILDPDVTEPIRAELTWIARLLGEARDAEVMLQRLEGAVSAQPVELVLGSVSARIHHSLGHRYRQALATAHEAMESPRYLDLLAGLDRLVADPPFTTQASERATDVVPALVRQDWTRLRRRVAAVGRAREARSRDLALHECRKAAKRLRYSAEAARPVLRRDAKRIEAAAKATQKLLGEHQDSVVSRAVLRELGVQAQLDGDSAFTFGLLYGTEQQRAATIEKEFRRVWRSKTLPSLRSLAPGRLTG